MFTFLLVVHIIIAAALVTVILMQRSEGGGLASSGNPAGLMSARGAADFLTRATSVLATIFVVLSITLAALATAQSGPSKIDTSLVGKTATSGQPDPAPAANDPLAAAAAQGSDAAAPANGATPK
jgi:preprotein translocase subunit SecG